MSVYVSVCVLLCICEGMSVRIGVWGERVVDSARHFSESSFLIAMTCMFCAREQLRFEASRIQFGCCNV